MPKFRPNVALILMDDDERLLVCERIKVRDAWQFPQGGVGKGETYSEALEREVEEEIGLPPGTYEVLESRGGYRYLFPPDMKRKKKRRKWAGQEQTYFLCRIRPDAPPINVHDEPREFRGHKWIDPKDFSIDWLPEFKKDVYRSVMRDFFNVSI